MYNVYVLKNESGQIYIGQTNNLEKRLAQHNGKHKGFTDGKGPFIMIHVEHFLSRSESMKREKELKSSRGRNWIKSNLLQVI